MNPDVIVSWPRNCDYPLWREMIRENRDKFGKVIIAFTETNQGHDYRDFIREAMLEDKPDFIEPTIIPPNGDWRNEAVNKALWHATNEDWLWFTEQDFMPKKGFWDVVDNLAFNFEAIGIKDGTRLHPCCLFTTWPALNSTRRNFGIEPGKSDHFGMIQEDLEAKTQVGLIAPEYYHHMNGLSHNYRLMESGEEVTYKPDEFTAYLQKCLGAKVPIDDYFREQIELYMNDKRSLHTRNSRISDN